MTPPWIHHGPLEELVAIVEPGAGPSVCVVVGEAGSGRTSVVRRLTEQTALPVLWVDGSAYARSGRLESVVDLAYSGLLPFLALAGSEELEPILADRETADPLQVARDLWLVAQAHPHLDAPRLCVVDDFDLLDATSQVVVAYLLRRVSQLSTAAVLVARPSRLDTALRGLPVVELRPLDVGQAREHMERIIDQPVPYRVAQQICRATAGVPLAIGSVVNLLSPPQLAGLDLLPHPLPLGDVTARRLLPRAGLSTGQRRLLAALAIEESLRTEQAKVLLGADTIEAAVDEGVVHVVNQVVRPVSPAQALAVWTATAELERWAVHRLLAGATADTGCERLHRALGGEDVEADEVADFALAAYHSGELTHVALGVQLLGHALPRRSLPLAAMLYSDGYVETVRIIADTSRGRPGFLDDGEVAWLQTQVALLSGVVSDPLPVDLPPLPPDADADSRRDWAVAVLGVARALWHRGDLDRATRTMNQAAPGFDAAPADLKALARVVRAEIGVRAREGWARAGLSTAAADWLRLKPPGYDIGSSIVAFMLLSVGDPNLAKDVVDGSQPRPHDGGLAHVGLLASRVHVEMAQCHYQVAEGLLMELDRIMPYSRKGVAHLLAPQIQVNAVLGLTPLREHLEWRLDGEEIFRLPRTARADVSAALGLRSLVDGDFERSAVLLRQAVSESGSLYDPKTAVVADLLEATRAAGGSVEQARALLGIHTAWLPDREGMRYPALMARCEALAAAPEEADAAFAAAAELTAEGFPVGLARTLLAHARMLRAVGRFGGAESRLERASLVFQGEGLAGWVTHVEMLRATPPRGLGPLLTPTERQIVQMALERRTNSEIAQALFMSKRSVELRLTRTFRKLGISRKSQLADLDLSFD